MTNKLRQALLTRRLSLGGWVQIGHPAVAEVLAHAGFDWLCVDLEHGAIDIGAVADIFRAIQPFDCVPAVRVPANDPIWIHRCLDGTFVGPYDLSDSFGVPGRLDHPAIAGSLANYRSTCAAKGVATGLHIVQPTAAAVRQAVDDGYALIALGLDTVFLHEAATSALAAARGAGRK